MTTNETFVRATHGIQAVKAFLKAQIWGRLVINVGVTEDPDKPDFYQVTVLHRGVIPQGSGLKPKPTEVNGVPVVYQTFRTVSPDSPQAE